MLTEIPSWISRWVIHPRSTCWNLRKKLVLLVNFPDGFVEETIALGSHCYLPRSIPYSALASMNPIWEKISKTHRRQSVQTLEARHESQQVAPGLSLILPSVDPQSQEIEPRSGLLKRQRRPRHRNPGLRERASFHNRRQGLVGRGCSYRSLRCPCSKRRLRTGTLAPGSRTCQRLSDGVPRRC